MKGSIVLAGLYLLAPAAFAQLEYGFYIGAGFGNFEYRENLVGVDPAFSRFADSSSSWKFFSGYDFTEHFGAEISIGRSGTVSHSFTVLDPLLGTSTYAIAAEYKVTAVRGMGYLPFANGALFAGVGMFDADVDTDLNLSTACCGNFSQSGDVPDDGATVLLGAQWQFAQIMVRLEYEWWDVDSADAEIYGIGIAYRY